MSVRAAWTRAVCAAAAVLLLLLLGLPGTTPRARAPDLPTGEAPAPPEGESRSRPRFIARAEVVLRNFPQGDPVPEEELRDDPNRVPGPDLIVRGVVLRDGRGVAGAGVSLHRAHSSSNEQAEWGAAAAPWLEDEPTADPLAHTVTAEDGSFEMRTARRTRLVVEARHEGAPPRRALLHMPLEGRPDPVRIDLLPGHRLAIRVEDPEGPPVPRVPVTVRAGGGAGRCAAIRDEPWKAVTARATTAPPVRFDGLTDDAGRAVIEALPAGPAEVVAAGMRGFVVVPTGCEVVFVAEPSGAIEGTLSDAAGGAVAGAVLAVETAARDGHTGVARGRTDGDGTFRIPVAPGGFASAFVAGLGPLAVPPVRVPAGGTLRWDPVLPVPAFVHGTVVGPDGPAPGVRVLLRRDLETVAEGWSDAAGGFTLRAWNGERHTLRAEGYGLLAEVAVAAPADGVRVLLVPCARVVGRIAGADGPDLHCRTVALLADGFERRAFVDGAGRFAFEHVPPLRNARVDRSGPFDVPAGKGVTIDLRDPERPLVEGVVTDAAGRPVEGAVVYASGSPYGFMDLRMIQPSWPPNVLTDGSGRFAAKAYGGPNQRIAVVVHHPDFAPALTPWLPRDERIRVDVVLSPGLPVGGRVLQADGRPLRNAAVMLVPESGRWRTGPLRMRGSTHTDRTGAFLFPHQAAGAYRLHVFDCGVDLADLVVEAGRNDLVVRRAADGVLAGVVLRADGRPPGEDAWGLDVVAGGHGARVRPDGWFRIEGLPPGRHDVVVTSFEGYVLRLANVPTGTEDLVLRLPPADGPQDD